MNHGFIHRVLFDRYCQVAQIHPPVAYETDNISILLELVKENWGIAVVTELAPKGEAGIKTIDITGVPTLIPTLSFSWETTCIWRRSSRKFWGLLIRLNCKKHSLTYVRLFFKLYYWLFLCLKMLKAESPVVKTLANSKKYAEVPIETAYEINWLVICATTPVDAWTELDII